MRAAESSEIELEIEGRELRFTNLDRVMWPRTGFTKGEMLMYYEAAAPVLLPHVRGRAMTMHRLPEGVEGRGWFQAQCRGRPDWLPAHRVRGRRGDFFDYCVVNDLPSLLWVINQGTIELHPFLALAHRPEAPTSLVFDLDPGAPATLLDCCEVALWLRELLDGMSLVSFPKTSGSLGLHLYVPLNGPHDFASTKQFARTVARRIERRHPERVIERMTRALRSGKVLVDWLQNVATRSTVAAYSLRAMPWPTVSAPVSWDEVEEVARTRRPARLVFGPDEVVTRIEERGDLFAPVLALRQRLERNRPSA